MRTRTMDAAAVRCVVLTSIATMIGVASPSAAWAAPCPGRVVVDADQLLPEHAAELVPRVRATAEQHLQEHHEVRIDPRAAVFMAIELRPIVGVDERNKVIFRVAIFDGATALHRGAPTSCWGCDEESLLESVVERVDSAAAAMPRACGAESSVPLVRSAEAGSGRRPEPGHDAPDSAVEAQPPRPLSPEGAEPESHTTRRPSRVLRNVGIGLTAAGVAVTGAGVGMVVAPVRRTNTSAERAVVFDPRPSGVALAAVGGAIAAGGVASLVIDAVRRRRAVRLTVGPTASSGRVGVFIGGQW